MLLLKPGQPEEQKKPGKLTAFLFTKTVSVLKEIDDGCREGWSSRDLIMDNLGILGAIASSNKIKFTCSYDTEKFLIRAHFLFR